MACAPPILKILSTPTISAAANTKSFLSPCGVGTTIMISLTPATCAGITFIKTEEGYAAFPPGT